MRKKEQASTHTTVRCTWGAPLPICMSMRLPASEAGYVSSRFNLAHAERDHGNEIATQAKPVSHLIFPTCFSARATPADPHAAHAGPCPPNPPCPHAHTMPRMPTPPHPCTFLGSTSTCADDLSSTPVQEDVLGDLHTTGCHRVPPPIQKQ